MMELRANSAAPARKSGLGRGLSALIPDATETARPAPGQAVVQLRLEEIVANPEQPRRHFAENAMAELVASVMEKGVLAPILVRPVPGGHEIVAGERRYRAAQRAGLTTIPAIVRDLDRKESLELALIENLQRADLNPIEEAEAYQQLMTEFGYTQEIVSRKVGKDRSSISNSLRLLRLPEVVRRSLIEGRISMGHGRALLGCGDPDTLLRIHSQVVTGNLNVRQAEELVHRAVTGTRPSRPKKELPAPIQDVQERLARHFGTRVRIKARSRGEGGRIVIDYFSPQELNRLIDRIETPAL
jgi:ParB family chromosome partitioning protein